MSIFFEEHPAFVQKCLDDSGLFGLTQFLKYSVLFLIKDLILLLIQGGSMATILFGIRLLMILRIAL